MTLLDDPPVTEAPAPTVARSTAYRPSAWRLSVRLARRETRRRPGRTILGSLLIAVPVFAMTIGSVLVRSENSDWADQFERRYGSADIAVDPSVMAFAGGDSGPVVLPVGTTSTEYLWVSTPVRTTDPAVGVRYVVLTDLDLADPAVGDPIEALEGRAPGRDEIMIPPDLADALDVGVGDTISLARPSGEWTVSGIGRYRDSYYTDVIVVPGFDRERVADGYAQTVTLYDLPDDTPESTAAELAMKLGGFSRFDDPYGSDSDLGRGMAWGWVAGVLALVAVGIIVAAAFATSARRQLVTIGQLTSNGATPSVVRRTLALQGTWTGLAGSVVGIAAGLIALPFVQPVIERTMLQHDLATLGIHVGDLLVIVVTATIAGTIAAAVPARSASRIPVMSALAGRRPLGALPRWLVPVGLVLLAVGLGFVAIASLGVNGARSSTSDDVWALLVVLGVVGVVFGMCCATPLVIERIGRSGRRASLSWRLALRTLGRSRTRSSAVVAAIAVAVGGSVAAAAIVETTIRENAAGWIPFVPADTVAFDAFDLGLATADSGDDTILDLDALPDAPLPPELRDRILAVVPDATIEPIRVATIDPAPFDTQSGDGAWPDPHGPRIADDALLRTLGLSSADVDLLETTGSLFPRGTWEIANSGPDDGYSSVPVLQYVGPDGPIEVTLTPATTAYRYSYAGWGFALLTESHARELGFDIVERGAIVRADRDLTVEQRDQLAVLQTELGGEPLDAFIEPGDPPRTTPGEGEEAGTQWNLNYDEPRYRSVDENELWIARLVILAAVVLITLLVVSIGLSLAAAEGRDERNVLSVVGATPASLRRQAAATAAVLALSGIALGIPTGYLPVWVLYSVLNIDQAISTEPLRFPWLVIGGLLLIVPALMAAVAWAGSGVGQRFRRPTPTRRD